MGRVLVALDPEVGLSATELAAHWDTDEQARALGAAAVEPSSGEQFLPGLVELVAIPLVVNVASAALCEVVSRLVRRLRPRPRDGAELELTEVVTQQGDRVLVVRLSGLLRS
ncbi:MAG TPA: hypothetical protein VLJ59_12605 [Mycobacteriales bacterium]|nr:hypothetical protein [Mycobacteriales bacterium]